MSNKLLIIGKNSFLANELIKKLNPNSFLTISHKEALARDVFDGIDCIINFSYNPKLNEVAYEESLDVDYLVRKKIIGLNIHYVMISTRKVYGSNSEWNSKEGDELRPSDYYGVNKKKQKKGFFKSEKKTSQF